MKKQKKARSINKGINKNIIIFIILLSILLLAIFISLFLNFINPIPEESLPSNYTIVTEIYNDTDQNNSLGQYAGLFDEGFFGVQWIFWILAATAFFLFIRRKNRS